MFYFTCNESKIYESFTFWNKLQEQNNFFTIFKFSEMYLYINKCVCLFKIHLLHYRIYNEKVKTEKLNNMNEWMNEWTNEWRRRPTLNKYFKYIFYIFLSF